MVWVSTIRVLGLFGSTFPKPLGDAVGRLAFRGGGVFGADDKVAVRIQRRVFAGCEYLERRGPGIIELAHWRLPKRGLRREKREGQKCCPWLGHANLVSLWIRDESRKRYSPSRYQDSAPKRRQSTWRRMGHAARRPARPRCQATWAARPASRPTVGLQPRCRSSLPVSAQVCR